MNLILAQGAEHTKPENLKKIVGIINDQRWLEEDIAHASDMFGHERMLATKINDIYVPEYCAYWRPNMINLKDYSVEEKYDGFSYLNSDGKFFSKRLSDAKESKGQPIEKTGHLPHISPILKYAYEMCGCDLHGEIYIPNGISDDVTKILGCTEDKAQTRVYEMQLNCRPRFMLIDIRRINGFDITKEPHRIRRAILEYVYTTYIKPLDSCGYVQLTEELHGDPREEFRRIVRRGGEGIIIKREDAEYHPGKKPANNWIKGKKKITYDVVLMGLNQNGTGKNTDLFGSMEFGHIVDGKLVRCGNASSGLSDEIRQHIYRNADAMIANHQVFEIEAIQESVKSFRNAVFLRLRDDKDWTECTPINIRVKEELI